MRDELIAHLQWAYALAQDGDPGRAQAILAQCTTVASDLAAQADVALYRGLIAREIGDLEAAADSLAEAQAGFEAAGDSYQAGVAASYRGRAATDIGCVEEALLYHHAAFQHFLAAADLMGIGNELARLGLILRQLHRHQEAWECFHQALAAHETAGHWPSVLVDRLNLVSTARDLDRRPLSQEHAAAAQKLARQLNDPVKLAYIDYLLAGLAADAGRPTEALERFGRAQYQAEALAKAKLRADSTLGLGLTRYALSDLTTAGETLAVALAQYIQLEDVEGQAVALGNLGLVHLANGNLEKAEQSFLASIDEQQKRGDMVAAARQQGNLGLVLRAQGKWPEAEQLHRQALHVLAAAGDTAGQATQRVNLASLAYLRGRFREAEDEYREALALYETADHLQGQADVLANLGNIAHAQTQWEKAFNYYQGTLVRYRQIEHHRGQAGLLANMGVIYRKLGSWPKAIAYYEQAIERYQEAADRPGIASTLNNIALVRRLTGDFNGALSALDQARALYAAIGDRRGQAAAMDNLGLLLLDAGEATRAADYHREALAIYRELGLQAGIMVSLGNLANALVGQGEHRAAHKPFHQALALAKDLGDGEAESRLLVARGDLYRRQGDINAARTDYEAALAFIEEQRLSLVLRTHRESFLGRERQSVYARLATLLVRQKKRQRAWQVCEYSRGRILLDQLAQSHLPPPAGVEQTWWQRLQSSLDQIRTLSSEATAGENLAVLPENQAWQLLAEAQNGLRIILAGAPESAMPWLDLVQGRPVSYGDLRNHLSV